VLRALLICRISTIHQDERSLADQEHLLRSELQATYRGEIDFTTFATRGSGEHLDREELDQIRDAVRSQRFDLVMLEDLGRFLRSVAAVPFVGLCLDCGTRVVALNDHLDTANENWLDSSLFAVMRHTRYNDDTAQRIKRSQRARFQRDGGMVQTTIYGYFKPVGCRSDAELQKDPDAEVHVQQVATLLEGGASWSACADYLNDRSVKVGPFMRQSRWDGRAVKRWFANPLLSGRRERNRKHTVKHHQSGHRRSVDAPPEQRLVREVPHLAFLPPERHEQILEAVRMANLRYRRGGRSGSDPRRGVPRSATRWPGQACWCAVCGRLLIYGGHGQASHLLCSGARDHRCWAAATFDASLAARQIAGAVLAALETLDYFQPAVHQRVCAVLEQLRRPQAGELARIELDLQRLHRQKQNLVEAIASDGLGDLLREKLDELGRQQRELEARRRDLQASPVTHEPPTPQAVLEAARKILADLAAGSGPVARALAALTGPIWIEPWRLIDDGAIVTRASFVLDLSAVVRELAGPLAVEAAGESLRRPMRVDLFQPPQREQIRQRVVAARRQDPRRTLESIAAELHVTPTAVGRALRLQSLMDQRGVADAYEPLTSPPQTGRLRRHRHPRYRFEPLEGFPRPILP
jgi:DNA invertase Pin-like site-specific DNA recombinase